MVEVAISAIARRLQGAFEQYRQNPGWRFPVELRRVRAEQIRRILANPESVTLGTFNREVWVFASETKLDGRVIKYDALIAQSFSPDHSADLTHALQDGRLELHGNFVWGAASRIYGPMLSLDDAAKTTYMRRALAILNDTSLSPLHKAQQIMGIPGFGANITTGLVMVFHPDAFAIMNAKSREGLRRLGYELGGENDLAQFEQAAAALRQRLGADDFLELDFFLYLISERQIDLSPRRVKIAPGEHGRFWDECREGGYICVGWDNLGDLNQYPSQKAFRQRFSELYAAVYNNPSTTSAKANEVWRLRELQPGDLIIANRGTSEVLGIGEVVEPGYQWCPERAEYKHAVKVRWDTTNARHIPEQKDWAFKTVADVSPELYELITASTPTPIPSVPASSPVCWWVNQGYTYTHERSEGYLFAPQNNNTGHVLRHHENVNRLVPGDVVLHYAEGAIRAVSRVVSRAEEGRRPVPIQGIEDEIGYLVRAKYEELSEPIALNDVPIEWRISEAGPFNRLGGVNQGYLYPLTVDFVSKLRARFPEHLDQLLPEIAVPAGSDGRNNEQVATGYVAPSLDQLAEIIAATGLRIDERTLRRYHLSLHTRGFVILSGLSGTGKTWLAEAYAKSSGAEYLIVPVAPNWTTNEDLLGYFNPIDNAYHDTEFSRFLRRAAQTYLQAEGEGQTATPYHLILDEMNLARVEYYFAKFLSAMEIRARNGNATLEVGPHEQIILPPNLYFVGTVNVDETTHGFADKVYDRAQLIEVGYSREALEEHLGSVPYREVVLDVWDILRQVAPFAFRIVDEMKAYIARAEELGVRWEDALDEQLLQKVLPKCKGADLQIGPALRAFHELTRDRFLLSAAKAAEMLDGYQQHGFTTYF